MKIKDESYKSKQSEEQMFIALRQGKTNLKKALALSPKPFAEEKFNEVLPLQQLFLFFVSSLKVVPTKSH